MSVAQLSSDGGHLNFTNYVAYYKFVSHDLYVNLNCLPKKPSLRARNDIPLKWFLHWLHYRLVFFTGKPFVLEFPIWFPNEPDNADPGEECVTFHAEGKLRDVPCFYNLPFLCEINLDLP